MTGMRKAGKKYYVIPVMTVREEYELWEFR